MRRGCVSSLYYSLLPPGKLGSWSLAPHVSASLSTKWRCFQNNPLQEGSPSQFPMSALQWDWLKHQRDGRFVSFLQPITLQTRCVHQASRVLTKALPLLHLQREPTDQLLIAAATKDVVSRAVGDGVLRGPQFTLPQEGRGGPDERGFKTTRKRSHHPGGPNQVAVARASYSSPTESPAPVVPVLWVGWVCR